ncbi:hypothetical protein [Chryseolinea lacunae]|uniref:Uncharacterized protein n=1 Tax=Chryseolinea lacunae TaxID=2801331 RepID=A0ABS1KQM8_9BACT|nr:hypothetical protein [Chryseolinea lacunae]MBL0740992.1 hypothetical protein [Chryseolinea lacunae]
MNPPLLKLPTNTEIVLYLLKEELKMNRFFTDLDNMGVQNHSDYQLELSPLVFACMGLEGSDETFERYVLLLIKHTENVGPDNDTLMKVALAFYADLVLLHSSVDK